MRDAISGEMPEFVPEKGSATGEGASGGTSGVTCMDSGKGRAADSEFCCSKWG
jgi:hypothetical protein